MTKKKKKTREKITDHITYLIENSTIYLFIAGNKLPEEELNILYKKLPLVIEDNDLSYINISGRNLENNKQFFQNIGFTLSYYDVNKLGQLYADKKDKISYKCYGIMTKKDFFNKIKEEKIEENNKNIKITKYSYGYIYNLLILFGGVILLCYFCVYGAIYIVK